MKEHQQEVGQLLPNSLDSVSILKVENEGLPDDLRGLVVLVTVRLVLLTGLLTHR